MTTILCTIYWKPVQKSFTKTTTPLLLELVTLVTPSLSSCMHPALTAAESKPVERRANKLYGLLRRIESIRIIHTVGLGAISQSTLYCFTVNNLICHRQSKLQQRINKLNNRMLWFWKRQFLLLANSCLQLLFYFVINNHLYYHWFPSLLSVTYIAYLWL